MQKFALIFLVAVTALLGFVAPVESLAVELRETNAERFARGMPPLPPAKRDTTNVAKRADPSPRAFSPTLPERSWASKRAPTPSNVRRAPTPSTRPPTRAYEKRGGASKRATPSTIAKRSLASKRAPTPAYEKRGGASKRATPSTVAKRSLASKRAPTPSGRALASSKRVEVFQMQHSYSGRLEVRWASNGTVAGYVANNPTGGPFGLNDPMFGEDDLYVEYYDSNLMVVNPEFPPPYFVGGSGALPLAHDCSGKIQFASVELGPSSAIWTLNSLSGALNATWTNQDGSEYKPSLAYDPEQNVLSFTGATSEYPVHIYLSD